MWFRKSTKKIQFNSIIKILCIFITTLTIITYLVCGEQTALAQTINQNKPATVTNSHSWSYGGENNPTHWGELEPEYHLCDTGREQSPVDFKKTTNGEPSNIELDYKPTSMVVENNGHTVLIPYNSDSYATFAGEKYQLVQFHFHTPSEHLIKGNASAMELHLVHKNPENNLSVIGVFIKEGKANPTLEKIWENMPTTPGKKQVEGVSINVKKLLPKSLSHYQYQGSLTTPPCTQGVLWNVLLTPIEASKEQIEKFEQIFTVNARPVQSLNGREVELNT
jgi:carbonic anhydrase